MLQLRVYLLLSEEQSSFQTPATIKGKETKPKQNKMFLIIFRAFCRCLIICVSLETLFYLGDTTISQIYNTTGEVRIHGRGKQMGNTQRRAQTHLFLNPAIGHEPDLHHTAAIPTESRDHQLG